MYKITKGSGYIAVEDSTGQIVWTGDESTFLIVDGKAKKVMDLPDQQIMDALIEKGLVK